MAVYHQQDETILMVSQRFIIISDWIYYIIYSTIVLLTPEALFVRL